MIANVAPHRSYDRKYVSKNRQQTKKNDATTETRFDASFAKQSKFSKEMEFKINIARKGKLYLRTFFYAKLPD